MRINPSSWLFSLWLPLVAGCPQVPLYPTTSTSGGTRTVGATSTTTSISTTGTTGCDCNALDCGSQGLVCDPVACGCQTGCDCSQCTAAGLGCDSLACQCIFTSTTTSTTSTTNTTGSTGTTGSTTAGSGTTTGCALGGNPAPALTCTIVDGGSPVVAGQPVEIDCTAAGAQLAWSIQASPVGATISDHLSDRSKAFVSYAGSQLPIDFPDSAITVTITVQDCTNQTAAATQTLSYPMSGNLLVDDVQSSQVESLSSDGKDRGTFISGLKVSKPVLLARLDGGNILVESTPNPPIKTLQWFDPHGNLLGSFDETDNTNNGLWPTGTVPGGAAQDNLGNIWVSCAAGSFTPGAVYIFDQGGAYLSTAPAPAAVAAHSQTWAPGPVAALPDGTILVGQQGVSSPVVAVYSPGMASTEVTLAIENCTAVGGGGVTCAPDAFFDFGAITGMTFQAGKLVVGVNTGQGSAVATFDDQLRFILSSVGPPSSTGPAGLGQNTSVFGIEIIGQDYIASEGMGFGGCLLAITPDVLDLDTSFGGQFQPGCWSTATSGETVGLLRLR